MALNEEQRLEHIRTYAWSWFSFHADQRTKMFNYFVASSAFLVAGYASAISSHSWLVALVIGVLGTSNGAFFWRLDIRNEELVNYGKAALHNVERAIFMGQEFVMAQGDEDSSAVAVQNRLVNGISLADKNRDDNEKKGKAAQKAGQGLTGLQRFRRGKHGFVLPLIEILLSIVFGLGVVFAACHLRDPAKPGTEEVVQKLASLIEKVERTTQDREAELKEAMSVSSAHNDQLAAAVREIARALTLPPPLSRPDNGKQSAGGRHPAKGRTVTGRIP